MRSSRTARRAATVIAALALGVGLAAPAQAAVEKHDDPAKDVTKLSEASPNGKRVKSNKTVDVTRFTTRHGKSKVTLTTTLRKVSDNETRFTYFVRTPESNYVADGSFTGRRGDVVVFDIGDSTPLRAFGAAGIVPPAPDCSGAVVKASVKKSTFAVTIPRSCLGGPAWVRTGGIVGEVKGNGYLIDEVRRAGFKNIDERPKLGKKVDRG